MELTMPAFIVRRPGWDSELRQIVARRYDGLRNFADLHNIQPPADDAYRRGDGMKVWSVIVRHFGSTQAIADELGIEVRP